MLFQRWKISELWNFVEVAKQALQGSNAPRHLQAFQWCLHRRDPRAAQGWISQFGCSRAPPLPLEGLFCPLWADLSAAHWVFLKARIWLVSWCSSGWSWNYSRWGRGWRFWGVATSLVGFSSPLHSISGWSSLPAPQRPSVLSLDLDCSVFYLHFWLDCWLKGISALRRGTGQQEINPKVLFAGVTKRMWPY